MQKEWIINNKDNSTKKPLIERLLANRGITQKKEVEEFLNPLSINLTSPNVFCDMKKAVERIEKAISSGENILIYGDFDADGITSTSLLMRTLTFLNAKVDYFIPNREKDNHGLNNKALVKLMTTKKPKVLITVDCGISNIEEITFLNSFKIDTILTDHHEAPQTLPQAFAIINPKAQNALDESLSAKEIEHLTSLAGVGVAFKLAQALLIHHNKTEFIDEIIPYIAVGTISDIVPLIGENRYFVTKGLDLIAQGRHYGIKRLLEVAGYKVENGVNSEQIAFGVTPRLNASGRLENVTDSMTVMLSDNKQALEVAIASLNNLNKIRQDLCANIFLEAEDMFLQEKSKNNSIILFKKDWHVGIIGIVASQLVEKYYKPTFLVTYSEETDCFKCSARGVNGLNIYDIMSVNSELLEGFGGHEMAGGLSFKSTTTSFNQIKKAFNETIDEMLNGKKLSPCLNIDLELETDEITPNLIEEISQLEPFGASNPSPVFSLNDCIIKEKKLMGSNKDHLKLIVQKNNDTFNCIWWSKGDIPLIAGDKIDIAFSPKINTYNDVTSVQLILNDIHSNLLEEYEHSSTQSVVIYDHRKKTGILPLVDDYIKTSKLDVSVFVENKIIDADLKPYKSIYQNIVSRKTLKKCDSIMFFDYPPSDNSLQTIIKTCNPKHIHFMPYDSAKIDEKTLFKTLAGMIKFACNNKNGCFDINSASTFLAIEPRTVNIALKMLEEAEMIKIAEINEPEFVLKYLQNKEFSAIQTTKLYPELKTELNDLQEYRLNLLNQPEIEI